MNGVGAEVMIGEAQPRGIKRAQDDALDDEQRFTKRFHLLNLGPPLVSYYQSTLETNPTHSDNRDKLYIPLPSPPQHTVQANTQSNSRPDDHMQLDDTKDCVYIHSLDDELADIESDEERLIFLPDIEKKMTKIPQHVLTGNRSDSNQGQELVLYSVPASLSVPADKDSVRKAILESRQRAREKPTIHINHVSDNPETAHGLDATDYLSHDIEHSNRGPANPEIGHGLDTDYFVEEFDQDDPDAMDIG